MCPKMEYFSITTILKMIDRKKSQLLFVQTTPTAFGKLMILKMMNLKLCGCVLQAYSLLNIYEQKISGNNFSKLRKIKTLKMSHFHTHTSASNATRFYIDIFKCKYLFIDKLTRCFLRSFHLSPSDRLTSLCDV